MKLTSNKMLKSTLFCMLLQGMIVTGFANDGVEEGDSNCWQVAGDEYQIDPWLLYAIASYESSLDPFAINTNTDGSRDVGLMQINSYWFERLYELGFDREDLFEPCVSIRVGAWILAESRSLYGSNWRALGAYNAGTGKQLRNERTRFNYAMGVLDRYRDLVKRLR